MNEEQKDYHIRNEPLIDEYHAEGRGTGSNRQFWVYRQMGKVKINYCQAVTLDAALNIARALNVVAKLDARIVQEFPFEDGSIFMVVKGSKAWKTYMKVAPIFERKE